jgi:hypothetical protein
MDFDKYSSKIGIISPRNIASTHGIESRKRIPGFRNPWIDTTTTKSWLKNSAHPSLRIRELTIKLGETCNKTKGHAFKKQKLESKTYF